MGVPLAPIPPVGPGSHTQNLLAYDPNLRTPYIQNYNFSIQRPLNQNTFIHCEFRGQQRQRNWYAPSTPTK